MTQIERELADHLQHLSVTIGPRPPGSRANSVAADYIEDALAEWGFAVDREPYACSGGPDGGDSARLGNVVGRIGMGLPGRVVLCARLDTEAGAGDADESAASIAVLLALGRLLAQHHLRHGLDLVIYNGGGPRLTGGASCGTGQSVFLGCIVATVSFDGPGQAFAPNTVSAHAASPALAAGVRRLLGRYPEAVWADLPAGLDHSIFACDCVPGLAVGGAAPAPTIGLLAHSTHRLREAAMLGAEIVALLQYQTPASCRASALATSL
ncbi:MAG: hypothetical protein HGA45_04275 [Chloroflexales bacterium]|nr:hypothetical protein [Chloroflexales bacterium]